MISVIIPVYNSEKYLRECLDSVLSQTFQDMEIIAVNNGSSDSSGMILEEYSGKDNRIKIINQENKGPGGARNAGLEMAKGKYLFFIDSDDRVEKNFLESLIQFSIAYDCDIVQGGVCYVYNKKGLISKQTKKSGESGVLNRKEAINELIKQRIIKNFAWGKLYKKDILLGLTFPDRLLFEDFEWTQNAIDRCNNYGYVNRPLYLYRCHDESLTGKLTTSDIRLLDALEERLEFIRDKYPEFYEEMKKTYLNYKESAEGQKKIKRIVTQFLKKIKDRISYPYDRIEIID